MILRRFGTAAVLLLLVPSIAHGFTKAVWDVPERQGVSQFPLYHRLGATIYETSLFWSAIARTRPQRPSDPNDASYAWPAQLDQTIREAARNHMRVLVQLDGAPAWANGGHRDWEWSPRHPGDFAQFAIAAARRYPQVHLWMIWGEPIRTFLPIVAARPGANLNRAQRAAPRRYARLLDATYEALKSVNRRNVVIGGDTYTRSLLSPLQWISNLRLPNGRPPRMDMYGHNPFGAVDPSFSVPYTRNGSVDFTGLPELARWIDRYLKRGLPLFLSEYTIPTAPDREMPFWVDQDVAARWVRDALRLCRHWKRIYALGWVHVFDDPPVSNGGLLTVDGRPKPMYWAFLRG